MFPSHARLGKAEGVAGRNSRARVKCDRSFFGADGQQRMSTSSLSRHESGLSKQTLDSQNHKKESSNGRGRDACAFARTDVRRNVRGTAAPRESGVKAARARVRARRA
eukprot:4146941-Pyramimonas_sp.AAC.1